MTQLQSMPAADCGTLLRQARLLLNTGMKNVAAAAGWKAALWGMEAYAGPDADFTDAARQLVKDRRGNDNATEWIVSAMALSDNAKYDWLDVDGVARRLDDVQRLVTLIEDIAAPPQTAEDLLRRARECLANGALAVASEKGWEAATRAAKTYAEAMGHDHIRSNYLSQVTRLLKQVPDGSKAGNWSMSAKTLLDNLRAKPDRLDAEMVGNDLDDVGKLVALVNATVKNGAKSSS
jgi:hypothetical protein